MAMLLARTLITKQNPSSILSRAASSLARLPRPLVLVADLRRLDLAPPCWRRSFSTRPSTSSLNDPSPNWNNRPPKETILLEGCDFEHWLIVLEKPDENMTRDDIIDSYIKTAAKVIGSEEEARMKIYSVSTKHYFAFGVIVSEEDSYKFKELPGVRWVLPDSYLDVRNKDYGGEPFINGEAVPYDPKYHEEWVRNNARANERSRRNDRPRNFDRTRNFERRRENTQAGNYGNPGSNGPISGSGGPPPNFQNPGSNGPNAGSGGPPPNFQNQSPNMRGGPPNMNVPNSGPSYGMPPNANMQSAPPNSGGFPNNPNMQNNAPNYGVPPPNQHSGSSYGDMPPRAPGANPGYSNMQNNAPVQNNVGFPPRDGAGYPNNFGPNAGYPNNAGNMQNRDAPYAPNSGGMPYQNQGPGTIPNMQNRDAPYAPNSGGMPYQNQGPGTIPNRDYQNSYVPPPSPPPPPSQSGNAYQVRDIPGRDKDNQ